MSSRPVRILAFAGSLREASCNKKLARAGAEAVRAAGAEATWIDLRDLALPPYDGDLERRAFPQGARTLRGLVADHDGMLLSTPEYNHGLSGVLKNALDWASRGERGEPPAAAFRGKVGAVVSAAPGIYGGVRGLIQLRSVLAGVGVLVVPRQLALSRAGAAFDDGGRLTDPAIEAEVLAIGRDLVALAAWVSVSAVPPS